jgi:enamine deaminase RidA (YjgF/YER057c/UK114 family)
MAIPPIPPIPPILGPDDQTNPTNQDAEAIQQTTAALDNLITVLEKATGSSTVRNLSGIGSGLADIVKAGVDLKSGDLLGGITGGIGALVDIGSSATTAFLDLAIKIDEVGVAMARATGYTDEYNEQVKKMAIATSETDQALFGLAVTLEEGGKAFTAMNNQMKIFPTLSRSAQTALATTALQFDRLGVSMDDTAKAYDLLTKGFGIGTQDINRQMTDFYTFAQETGQPLQEVVGDLNALGPNLARYGSQAKRVFKELSKEARLMGISAQEAFQVANMADTFEGAADLAGKLNAQLGLRITSAELLKAEEGERLQIIRDEFMMRQNFDDLNRREQQAIAEIMQVNADTARKLLTGQMDISQLQKQRLSTEEAAKKQTEAMKKFDAALQGFMLSMTPILEAVTGLLNKMGSTDGLGAMTILGGMMAGKGAGKILKMLKPGSDVTYHAEGSQRFDTGIVRGGPDGFYQPILPGDYTVTTPKGDVIAGTKLFGDVAKPEDSMKDKKRDIVSFLGTALGGVLGAVIPIPGVGPMMGGYLGSMAGDYLADALYAEDVAISRNGKVTKQPAGSFSVTGPDMNSFSIPQSQLQASSSGGQGSMDPGPIAEAVYKAVVDANKNTTINVVGTMERDGMVKFADDRFKKSQKESFQTVTSGRFR